MPVADTPPVILLGGAVNALSAARSLGARGIPVHAYAQSTTPEPLRWSRHVAKHVPFPGGSLHDWWTEQLLHDPRDAVVLPTSDHGLEFLARHRGLLEELGYVPAEANDRLVLALLDKGETYRVATAAGIQAPRSVHIKGIDDLDEHCLTLPCVVKPTQSHIRSAGFHALKAVHAHDRRELEAVVRATTADTEHGVVVSEVVPGPDDAFCSYYTYLVDGEPLFHYTKRKIRQQPIHFGDGTFHVSADVPEARELGLRLFRNAGLRGLGNVEFKRDARDGQLKLIECNLRLTAADPMIRAGGLDLPYLLYERARGRSGPPMSPHGRATGQWHPAKDVRAFLEYHRAGELTARAWGRSLIHPMSLPLFSLTDLGPSLGNIAASPRRLVRLARRTHAQRRAL
jgi:predicted ATP-grasp superfamily ATP-dependent carboligase